MKKIVLSVLFVLIGFVYANAETAAVSPELAAARAKYDTPFIKKYRPRYEANNTNLLAVTQLISEECEKKCSQKDKEHIIKLAMKGDMFSLAMSPHISTYDLFMENFKNEPYVSSTIIAADMGDPQCAAMLALWNAKKDYITALKYGLIATNKQYVNGYKALSMVYGRNGHTTDFCRINKKGYEEFGIEFLTNYLIYKDNELSKLFFSECSKTSIEEVLSQSGSDGKLIQGYTSIYNKEYDKAYKVFQSLYKPGDGSKISANAGYCLGMMNYYGKGVGKDLEKGRKLLKESFDNGVVSLDTPELRRLPAKLELISYYWGTCDKIKED